MSSPALTVRRALPLLGLLLLAAVAPVAATSYVMVSTSTWPTRPR